MNNSFEIEFSKYKIIGLVQIESVQDSGVVILKFMSELRSTSEFYTLTMILTNAHIGSTFWRNIEEFCVISDVELKGAELKELNILFENGNLCYRFENVTFFPEPVKFIN